MAFDGVVTAALVRELDDKLTGGRIDKIYQPEEDTVLLTVSRGRERYRLFLTSDGNSPRAFLTTREFVNPQNPMPFCMLLRKHFLSARIAEIRQVGSERIIEICADTVNDLGDLATRKLVLEIMGKHSNIIAVDLTTGKILDAIKRVSPDMSRVRPVLPGMLYQAPPAQEGKISFYDAVEENCDGILSEKLTGISKALSEELTNRAVLAGDETACGKFTALQDLLASLSRNAIEPVVYTDDTGLPREFHITPLSAFQSVNALRFATVSEAIAYYYEHRSANNRMKQRSGDLLRQADSLLSKYQLKKQKLLEELADAEASDRYRLWGELLTASLHTIPAGAEKAKVLNYYDNTEIEIPLEPRFNAAKNAQRYFKKYAKARTALKEKSVQLQETEDHITYLTSVLSFVERAETAEEIEAIRDELVDGGYLRKRKDNYKSSKSKLQPVRYTTAGGFTVLVGRNNTENDQLTFRTAEKQDIWFHTKDFPGSHVILCVDSAPDSLVTAAVRRGEVTTDNAFRPLQAGALDVLSGAQEKDSPVIEGYDLGVPARDLFEAAAIAAFHSKAGQKAKGGTSENIAVDYCTVRHVKKPSGAKPGMVIFTDNRTLYVDPKLPKEDNHGPEHRI